MSMNYEDLYKIIMDEKSRAYRYANEIMKEAKNKDITIPVLISALAHSYRIEGEIKVENEMIREEMNDGYLY